MHLLMILESLRPRPHQRCVGTDSYLVRLHFAFPPLHFRSRVSSTPFIGSAESIQENCLRFIILLASAVNVHLLSPGSVG